MAKERAFRPMRSTKYDQLHIRCTDLNKALSVWKNKIQKADVNSSFSMQEAKKANTEVDSLCTIISAQFFALKNDFDTGAINFVMYSNYLKTLENLLTDREEKIDNVNLQSAAIAQEIARFIPSVT